MDGAFFWISKIMWLFVSPDSLLVIYVGVTLLLSVLGWLVWTKMALMLLFSILLFIGIFPVDEWLFYPLEKLYIEDPELNEVDGIIVLSGSLERDVEFMALARKFPNAKLVFTGGSPSMIHQELKDADIARKFFVRQGLDVSRIVFERNSRNTWESAAFSYNLVKPSAEEKWVLITTAWHMPRSVGVFCKVGWNVIPYPVGFKSNPDQLFRIDWDFASHLIGLVYAVKEWIGLIAYKISDRSC